MAPSKDSSSEVEIVRPHERLVSSIQGRARLESQLGQSAAEVMANVTDKIAEATNEDALFAAANDGPGKIENYVGNVLRIRSFHYAISDAKYKGGVGAYVIIDAITEEGEEVTLSTGATNIVTMLARAEEIGLVNPETDASWRVRVKSRETGEGTLYTFDKP